MAAASPQVRGIHVFLVIAGFFAVTIGVNAIFIVQAIGTFPGEQVEKSYVQGLDFNRELDRRREQERLGWTAQAGLEEGVLLVRLGARDGAPVTNLSVEAIVHVAGGPREPLRLALEERAPGEYATVAVAVPDGRWEIEITARREPGEPSAFTATKSMTIQ
jgi:nitrogen fixation protein FixH